MADVVINIYNDKDDKAPKAAGRTIVSYVLDASGSMMGLQDEAISGFNEYVQNLKQDDNSSDVYLTFTTFNTDVNVVHSNKPLKDVPELNANAYSPNGMTALLDAIGQTIKAVDDIAQEGDKVLFVVMTDGLENSSREYDASAIGKLIKAREKKEWEFVYMGANQDAWATAARFGFKQGNVLTYTASSHGHTHAIRNLTTDTLAYTAGAKASGNFFEGKTKLGENDAEDVTTSNTNTTT